MKFVDYLSLQLRSGNGGSGCVSFFQDWMQKTSRPTGGDGGKGGDIIFISSNKVNSFSHLRHNQIIQSENGFSGNRQMQHGKNGRDTVLFVPVGTVLLNENKDKILFDFQKSEQSFTVVEGGLGGHGNAFFVSNKNKKSKFAQPGNIGEIKTVWLELKLLAKVGIIGLPNAGKSTLLSVLTNAKPEIASYEFTTLSPNLGVLKNSKLKILIADLPGIIEGASKNKGLGNQFLKHVERCYLLIHVLDLSVLQKEQIELNWNLINNELLSYSKFFAQIPRIIVGNKFDLSIAQKNYEIIKNIEQFKTLIPISSKKKTNLLKLINKIISFLQENPNIKTVAELKFSHNHEKIFSHRHKIEKEIRLRKLKLQTWELSGKMIRILWKKYNVTKPEELEKFNQHLKNKYLIECLQKHGIRNGDTIFIYGTRFKWKY